MAHRNPIIQANSKRNSKRSNNGRIQKSSSIDNGRIQKSSSIDCVLSDDDGDEEEIINSNNNKRNMNISNLSASSNCAGAALPHHFVSVGDMISSRSSMNNNHSDLIDDDASLYVNAKTAEDFSSNNNYNYSYSRNNRSTNPRRGITDHNDNGRTLGGGNGGVGERVERERGGVGTGRVVAFRGLSKSASRLLSLDRQTLSELLDVDGVAIMNTNNDDGAGGIDMNNISGMGGGGGGGVVEDIGEGNRQQTNGPDVAVAMGEEQEILLNNNNNNNNNESYLYYHIQQLEDKFREQNEKMKSLQRKWEEKLLEQEKAIEQKYKNEIDVLKSEIQTLQKDIAIKNSAGGQENKSIKEDDEQVVDITDTEAVCSFSNSGCVKKAEELVAELTPDQISRYSRQLLLNDGFGVKGQQRLLSSSVLGENVQLLMTLLMNKLGAALNFLCSLFDKKLLALVELDQHFYCTLQHLAWEKL